VEIYDPQPEPQSPPPPDAEPSELSTEPEAPVDHQTADSLSSPNDYRHDGFYLRLSLGGGYERSRWSHPTEGHETFETGSVGFDVLLGGAPVPGLVLGGMLSSEVAPSVTVKRAFGGASDLIYTSTLIGAFIDGFPDPERGFHLGAGAGFQLSSFDDDGGQVQSAAGGGAVALIGYDAFVSRKWSLGGLLRASGSLQSPQDTADARLLTGSISLLFSALYN